MRSPSLGSLNKDTLVSFMQMCADASKSEQVPHSVLLAKFEKVRKSSEAVASKKRKRDVGDGEKDQKEPVPKKRQVDDSVTAKLAAGFQIRPPLTRALASRMLVGELVEELKNLGVENIVGNRATLFERLCTFISN